MAKGARQMGAQVLEQAAAEVLVVADVVWAAEAVAAWVAEAVEGVAWAWEFRQHPHHHLRHPRLHRQGMKRYSPWKVRWKRSRQNWKN